MVCSVTVVNNNELPDAATVSLLRDVVACDTSARHILPTAAGGQALQLAGVMCALLLLSAPVLL